MTITLSPETEADIRELLRLWGCDAGDPSIVEACALGMIKHGVCESVKLNREMKRSSLTCPPASASGGWPSNQKVQVSEPKDAAAARRIIELWHNPIRVSVARYLIRKQSSSGVLNDRDQTSPAKYPVLCTPPMPELAPRAKPVAP